MIAACEPPRAAEPPVGYSAYFTPSQVGAMLGYARQTINQWFDAGVLSGFQNPRTSDRRISRASLLRYAHRAKIVIPQIGMYPFHIVTLGLDRTTADAVGRAAEAVDAVVESCETATDFGILVAPGEPCCGVVDTSIGVALTKDVARAVRRWPQTDRMLMIACSAEDQPPVGMIEAGYDTTFRRPFPPANLVRRITKTAREYQDARKAREER